VDTSVQLERIKNSRQFHKDWYKRTYLADATQAVDPAEHYLGEGAAKGFNPGKFFDTNLYVTRYPDVAVSGLNPLVHYEVIGAAEKRIVNPVKAQQVDKRAAMAAEKAKTKEREEVRKLAEGAAIKSASESARKVATEAARKVATETATKIVAAELKKITAQPKASANAQMAAGPFQSTALDELTKKARAAAQKKDWLSASRHWQQALALPAEPYVGLSEAAAEMGDMARAEEILRDGLAEDRKHLPRFAKAAEHEDPATIKGVLAAIIPYYLIEEIEIDGDEYY